MASQVSTPPHFLAPSDSPASRTSSNWVIESKIFMIQFLLFQMLNYHDLIFTAQNSPWFQKTSMPTFCLVQTMTHQKDILKLTDLSHSQLSWRSEIESVVCESAYHSKIGLKKPSLWVTLTSISVLHEINEKVQPNNSIGQNNSVGWQISQNLIILQDGIIMQDGNFKTLQSSRQDFFFKNK